VRASLEEVAAAVAALTGEPHPHARRTQEPIDARQLARASSDPADRMNPCPHVQHSVSKGGHEPNPNQDHNYQAQSRPNHLTDNAAVPRTVR
jgi:hypothetical protein